MSATIPNAVSYDPTYGFELAVIIREGLRRMMTEQEDVFYYLTLMNENYQHPAMPEGAEEGILRGMYLLQPLAEGEPQVQLMGSGTILREVLAGGGPAAPTTGASAPTSGASRASPSCGARAWRSTAGTRCIPARSRARRGSQSLARRATPAR